jgi:hypothetical protein
MASAEESIKNSLKTLAADFTKNVRSAAKTKGWDPKVADSIVVSENLEIQIPEELKEQAFNLEYGFERQPPKPVLRDLSYDSKEDISKAVYKGVSDFFTAAKVIK